MTTRNRAHNNQQKIHCTSPFSTALLSRKRVRFSRECVKRLNV